MNSSGKNAVYNCTQVLLYPRVPYIVQVDKLTKYRVVLQIFRPFLLLYSLVAFISKSNTFFSFYILNEKRHLCAQCTYMPIPPSTFFLCIYRTYFLSNYVCNVSSVHPRMFMTMSFIMRRRKIYNTKELCNRYQLAKKMKTKIPLMTDVTKGKELFLDKLGILQFYHTFASSFLCERLASFNSRKFSQS